MYILHCLYKKRTMADRQSRSDSVPPPPPSLEDLTSLSSENKKEETAHKVQVTVKKWNAVALWSWDTTPDTCAICRNLNMELCIECQVRGDQEGGGGVKECSLAWGVCTHTFHFHCIVGWIEQHDTCPLCAAPWDFQKRPA